jgi:transposase
VNAIVGNSMQAKRIKRPNFSVDFKRQIVEQTLRPSTSAAIVDREHHVNAELLFKWRRQCLTGDFGMLEVVPPQATALNGCRWP